MHLLDTDILTYLFAGHPRVANRLRGLTDPDVGTTIITRIEMIQGRQAFLLKASTGLDILRAQTLLSRTEELLSQILIVPFDNSAAHAFELLKSTKGLRKVGRADLLIASIALAHQAVLVTRNVRHFERIRGLHMENWLA